MPPFENDDGDSLACDSGGDGGEKPFLCWWVQMAPEDERDED